MNVLDELEQQLATIEGQIESAEFQLTSEHAESTFRSYLEGKLAVLKETHDFISYMIEKVTLNG